MTERESWEHYVGLNWTDRFNDPPEEEEICIDGQIDASKLSEEDFSEVADKIEELSHYEEDFYEKSDFRVNYFAKDGEDYETCFEIHGWAAESVYEELIDRIEYYGLKLSKIA